MLQKDEYINAANEITKQDERYNFIFLNDVLILAPSLYYR